MPKKSKTQDYLKKLWEKEEDKEADPSKIEALIKQA
jgi:hypothetical protein